MTKEFSSIVELKQIREQKSRLTERERELSEPILFDVTLIPAIHKCFLGILAERTCPPNPESVMVRKKFLFIILFLFAPSVLAGGRLPNGLRAEICKIFPNKRPSSISNNIADIAFIYQRYKDFRVDVDSVYNQLLERINKNMI